MAARPRLRRLQDCTQLASTFGRQDQSVLQALAEAQFLVRKGQRPDLYALLGVKGVGSKASEKEIRQVRHATRLWPLPTSGCPSCE